MSAAAYIKQLELGPMQNFVYLIGDPETRECVVVDPAWEIDAIHAEAAADDMRIRDVLVTHTHQDHVGGHLFGHDIPGVAELLEKNPAKVHVHKAEREFLRGFGSDLVKVEGGDTLAVGNVPLTFIHTPGHTPGSQCFLVDGKLVSGDTLFLDSCGRTDLPGGDPEALYESLTQKLAIVPDNTVLYPGHMYSPEPYAPLGEVRRTNYVYRPRTREQWMMMFGNDGVS